MLDFLDLNKIPKNINMPISDNLRKAIALAMATGYADSVPDFVRKSVVAKLEELGIFNEQIKKALGSSIFTHD